VTRCEIFAPALPKAIIPMPPVPTCQEVRYNRGEGTPGLMLDQDDLEHAPTG
jgi:hypothetical protein